MATRKATPTTANFLPGFEPLTTLWNGPAPLYPSEQSARWAVRKLGSELAKAQAVAVHRRALLVHPQRFAEVAEREALMRFNHRATRWD
jgi:hypothetical protein